MNDGSTKHNETLGRRSFLSKALGFLAGTAILGGLTKALAQAGKKNTASAGGKNTVDAFFSTPAVGQICMFAGNFAPSGWAFCDGSLLSISGNEALFSLIFTKRSPLSREK